MYISRFTFKPIHRLEHIRESVVNLIQTPKTTRVFRPELGTHLHQSIDEALTPTLRLQMIAEVIDVLSRYEPRVRVIKVDPVVNQAQFTLTVHCQTTEGEPLNLTATLQ